MLFKKKNINPSNKERYEKIRRLMWLKCESCGKLIYYKDYKDNYYICPKCNKTFIMTPKQRFDLLFDNNEWEKLVLPQAEDDPLNFVDRISYKERLKEARKDTGYNDSVVSATGILGGIKTTICILNGAFLMGSMGRVAGNSIISSIEYAIDNKQPFIMVTCSGGARMQENVLALMQMARTVVAINKLNNAKLPYIVLLTDPTFGGVSASLGMLGDIHIAEREARIGFAGRRVIEQNIREKLPRDFQTAEYALKNGAIDIVAERKDLKETISKILHVLLKIKKEPVVVKTKNINKEEIKAIKSDNPMYNKVLLARNELRPHFKDYIDGIVEDFTYLAGDRLQEEDPAMQTGIGYFKGIPSVIVGQEKGRDIISRQLYRFGMANPGGYRKVQRIMKLAEKFNLPFISLFDTAGAFAGKEGEDRGQSEAIAKTIQMGLLMKTPYVAVNVGEGGSGGAIAIATADKVLMLENAIYSVIAPESCASILWKDNKFKEIAAENMKLTAQDMKDLHIIDEIIPEPSGGAHKDWQTTMELLAEYVCKNIKELEKIDVNELVQKRAEKFLSMTRDIEIFEPENKQI